MNSVIEKIIGDITRNKSAIFELSNKYKKRENHISKLLFESLEWGVEGKSYTGLFGWGGHRTDGFIKIDNKLVIIEVKTVKPKERYCYEFNYFNALLQGLLYSYQQAALPENNFMVLCIILDWGRAAERELNEDERGFLDQFRKDRIHFLRVSLSNKKFIEHNINTNWAIIKEDG